MRQLITIEKNFLRIPVSMEATEKNMWIQLDGEIIYQCMVPLHAEECGNKCLFYAELPTKQWKGHEVEIIAENCEAVAFIQADELLRRKEDLYPYIHFAPTSGWINDPCGLCYYKGSYHLYFQHNMFSRQWNNMSWGHAVTEDFLHWEQKKEALLPDQDGAIYTGSAIVNEQGMLGLPKEALIQCYTSAGNRSEWSKGKKFDHRYAWSLDGENFTKLNEAVIPFVVYENRDGKIYRNEEAGNWFMIMFLDGHDYAIFVSEDMKQWKMTQRFTFRESWECPDLVRLNVKDSNEKKWVFWTPDGFYQVGEFDGKEFHPQQKVRQIYGNDKAYAAQTFANGKDRVIQIPWLKIQTPFFYPYNGMMGLPRELELIKKEEDYILASHPVREIDHATEYSETEEIDGLRQYETSDKQGALRWEIEVKDNQSFLLNVCGARMEWDSEMKCLGIGTKELALPQRIDNLSIIADRGIIEIGINNDTVVYYLDGDMKMRGGFSYEGKAFVTKGRIIK